MFIDQACSAKSCILASFIFCEVMDFISNQTQSNLIELNLWIEFDWVWQLNQIEHELCVSLISEPIKLNQKNGTEPN